MTYLSFVASGILPLRALVCVLPSCSPPTPPLLVIVAGVSEGPLRQGVRHVVSGDHHVRGSVHAETPSVGPEQHLGRPVSVGFIRMEHNSC